MHTERFNQLRKAALQDIFTKTRVIQVWRDIVRNQLRNMDIKDLYDHYDFNYNIEAHALYIRSEILSGNYKVSKPFIYKLEKKYGICRHLVIPQPLDALVLQVLVESLSPDILKRQSSKNVFYSRDKHRIKLPHEAWQDYWLTLKQQWQELQKKIYKFNEDKELLIVTDLSNYNDNSEVLIDLLFRIVEEISWRPDYLPYTNKGLPTSNLEAIRLLAHSFLYEIDEVTKVRSGDCFTRWMDDITIGVDTKKEAIELLSAISDMLKSRGLALNLAKTKIYNSDEAKFNFLIDENVYLDGLISLEKKDKNYNKITSEMARKFKALLKDTSPKSWDKVAKRYVSSFARFKSDKLLSKVASCYMDHPSLRPMLLYYLQSLGYKKRTSETVKTILDNLDVFDDVSLIQVCQLLTAWEIPIGDTSKQFLKEIDTVLTKKSFNIKRPSSFYALLHFKAKYSHPDELLSFLQKYKNLWGTDTFLRRQVTAVFSRLYKGNEQTVKPMLEAQLASGIPSTVTLANQIIQFAEADKIDFKLRSYLFTKSKQRPYPFSKFLVLCSSLNSESIRTNLEVKAKVLEYIKDPYYLKWLDQQYNISS